MCAITAVTAFHQGRRDADNQPTMIAQTPPVAAGSANPPTSGRVEWPTVAVIALWAVGLQSNNPGTVAGPATITVNDADDASLITAVVMSDLVQMTLGFSGGRGYFSDPYKQGDLRPRKRDAARVRKLA